MIRSSGRRMSCAYWNSTSSAPTVIAPDRCSPTPIASSERGADGERQVGEAHQQAADDLGLLVGPVHVGAHVVEAAHDVRAGAVGAQVFGRGEMLLEIGEEVRVDARGTPPPTARRGAARARAERRATTMKSAERDAEADVGDGEHDERAERAAARCRGCRRGT